MSNRVINLKKDFEKEKEARASRMSVVSVAEKLVTEEIAAEPREVLPRARLSWSAKEYETRDRSAAWFLGPFGIAVALVIAGILLKNYFFVAFVALAFVTLMLSVRRAPSVLQYAVTEMGIRAGAKEYPFADCTSFWIFETPAGRELSLETTNILMPYVRLSIGDTDAARLRRALVPSLPEREHKEFLSDHVARILGF